MYIHYDILSDIMIILGHGNICIDTIFMIIILHRFTDIEENLFFDNGGPHLHTHNILYYNMLSDSAIILDQGHIMCRHNFSDDIMHSCQHIEENRCFGNGGTNSNMHTIAQGRPDDNKVEFRQEPHGIVNPPKHFYLTLLGVNFVGFTKSREWIFVVGNDPRPGLLTFLCTQDNLNMLYNPSP